MVLEQPLIAHAPQTLKVGIKPLKLYLEKTEVLLRILQLVSKDQHC